MATPEFTLLGVGDDEGLARAQLLAELLARALPSFRFRKIAVRQEAWQATLDEEVAQRSLPAECKSASSPFIYQMLGEANAASAAVGHAPSVCVTPRPIGNLDAFASMARRYYAIEHEPSDDDVEATVEANTLEAGRGAPCTLFPFEDPPLTVCVSSAAGLPAYHLLSRLAVGDVFGTGARVDLRLVDGDREQERLEGVRMELEDCAAPCLGALSCGADLPAAASASDVVVFFAGSTGVRQSGGQCSKAAAEAAAKLGAALRTTAKVLVVGEGCASAACVLAASAPSLPKENVSFLARLPQVRAQACIAARLNKRVETPELRVGGADVHNVVAWGSDTTPPVIDTSLATVEGHGGEVRPGAATLLAAVLREPSFLVDGEATRTLDGGRRPDAVPGWVNDRDAAVTESRGSPPAMTVANAVADHLRVWCGGPGGSAAPGPTDRFETFGLWSDGNGFGVPDGLYFAFPATPAHVPGSPLAPEVEPLVREAVEAAVQERNRCFELVGLPVPEPPAPAESEDKPAEQAEGDGAAGGDGGDGGSGDGDGDGDTQKGEAEAAS